MANLLKPRFAVDQLYNCMPFRKQIHFENEDVYLNKEFNTLLDIAATLTGDAKAIAKMRQKRSLSVRHFGAASEQPPTVLRDGAGAPAAASKMVPLGDLDA